MKRFINYVIGLNVLVLGITLNTRSLLGVAAFTTLLIIRTQMHL